MSFNPKTEDEFKTKLSGELQKILPAKIDTLPAGLQITGRYLTSLKAQLDEAIKEKRYAFTFYDAFGTLIKASEGPSKTQPSEPFVTQLMGLVNNLEFRVYCCQSPAAEIMKEQYTWFETLRKMKIPENQQTVNTRRAQVLLVEFEKRNLARKYFDPMDFQSTLDKVRDESSKDPVLNDFIRSFRQKMDSWVGLFTNLYDRGKRETAIAQEVAETALAEKKALLAKMNELISGNEEKSERVRLLEQQVSELDAQAKTATQLGQTTIELDGQITKLREELNATVKREQFDGLKALLEQEKQRADQTAQQLAKAKAEREELEEREKKALRELMQKELEAQKAKDEAARIEEETKRKLAEIEKKAAARKTKLAASKTIISERDKTILEKTVALTQQGEILRDKEQVIQTTTRTLSVREKMVREQNEALVSKDVMLESMLEAKEAELAAKEAELAAKEAEIEELTEQVQSMSEAGGESVKAGERSTTRRKPGATNGRVGLGSTSSRGRELASLEPFVSPLRLQILAELSKYIDYIKEHGKITSKQKFIANLMVALLTYEGSTEEFFTKNEKIGKIWTHFCEKGLAGHPTHEFLDMCFKGIKAYLPDDVTMRRSDEVRAHDPIEKWTLMAKLFKRSKVFPGIDVSETFAKLAEQAQVQVEQKGAEVVLLK